MLTPYSPSGEEFLAALTAYFDKYGPQLMSGNMLPRGQILHQIRLRSYLEITL